MQTLAFTIQPDPLAWVCVGALAFSLIGFGFGAAVYWVGQRGGSRFGQALVETFGRLPEAQRRLLASGCDGALFLGLVGLVVGALAGPRGILIGLVALLGLIAGTFVFAGLAHNLGGRRNPVVTAVCCSAIGMMVGIMVTDGSPVAAVVGAGAGLLTGTLVPLASGSRPRPDESDESV